MQLASGNDFREEFHLLRMRIRGGIAMTEESSFNKRHVIIVVTALIAFSIGLIALAGYVSNSLEESGERQFLAYTEQAASFAGERAHYVQNALASFTVETDDPDQLLQALMNLQENYGFSKVGFAREDGIGIDANGNPFNAADITRKEVALSKGKADYSSAYVSPDGEYVYLAQIPLFIEGKQIGALYAQVPLALLLPEDGTYGENEECQLFIFDEDTGWIVATTAENDRMAAPGRSMYAYIERALIWKHAGSIAHSEAAEKVEEATSSLRTNSAAGQSAIVVGKINDVESYLCVAPTGNSTWSVASVIPVSSVRAEANLVRAIITVVLLIGAACMALAAIVGLIAYRRHARERHLETRRQLYDALSDSLDMAVSLYAPSNGKLTPIVAKDIDILGENLEVLMHHPQKAFALGMSEEGLELLEALRFDQVDSLIRGKFSLSVNDITTRHVEYTVRPLFYEGLNQLLVIMRDITEERSLQDSMKAAMEAAEAANRAKSEFLSRMSHEIRTPMNVITGMARIARGNIDNPAKLEDNLHHIENASKHLLDLISEVLDIAKIESGKRTIIDAPFNLMNMLRSLGEIIEPQCAAKGQSYSLDTEGPVDAIFLGDEVSLRQMLVNLLTNAMKYTDEGGSISLSVSVVPSLAAGYRRITFVVSDNGIGMSAEYLEHLFEPFVVEGRSSEQGTGLGMPIVRNIVNSMGGDIHVESHENEGTTFTIAVNKRLLESIDPEPGNTALASPAKPDLSGVRVLLVEDNPINAEIAAELLRMEGVEVDWANDGVDACEKFEHSAPNTYDVVLMDVRMPRMDGHEATRTIRAMTRDDAMRIPIIAMSANAFVDDVLASLTSGMNAHLSKPINMDELLATIARELGRA